MNYRRLGKAGVKVSELSLGSWLTFGDQISDDVAEDLMIKAYEGGINFFDNAEGYASGQSDLIAQGKVLYWGTSTWSAQEIMEAHEVARQYQLVPPTVEQPSYNLLQRHKVEIEYARLYDQIGLGTTIWSPLASGLLSGKYNQGNPADARLSLERYGWLREWVIKPERLEKVHRLGELAKKLGLPQSVLAIAWCLKNPHVSTVILGASKVSQLEENLTASTAAQKLTPEILTRIDEIMGTRPNDPDNSDNF